MTTWRERLLTRLGPPLPLCGITFSQWRNLLRANCFDVDSPYWLRAASTTAWSIVNTAHCWHENRVFGPKVANAKIEPPLIILGHWRTGTTHLHYLLALDERFAYPNTFQVTYPNTFLCTEALSAKLGAGLLPPTRPMDNVWVSFQAPNEDEFAICGMTLCSRYVGLVFPRRQGHYDPFLTFRGVAEGVIAQWKAALVFFLKKLTWKYGRPLVLKSPPHTGRIRLLLDLFPDARFVHIRRNPYSVFQSTRYWLRTAGPWWHLQRPDLHHLEARILRTYKEMYEVYFEERQLIPVGHFHEICFEELEAEPVAQMRKLYEALDLPDFRHVEPVLRRYLESLSDYKKNTLPELSPDLQKQIAGEWRRCFEKWGYPV
jgi:omega-hydroxy-beta-dihydromenaquinone-9 sulfotransferase